MLKVRPWIHVLVLAVLLALLLVAPMASALPRTAPQELQGKVSVNLLEELAANGTALFFVVMREQADLSGAAALPTKLAKGAFVFDALTSTAERTQGRSAGDAQCPRDRLQVLFHQQHDPAAGRSGPGQ
ncbi:MAG: hypothetical protein IPO15_23300 [Anaerolineae bacterium]|nr:hypothetical protein [Anaerolineae bacterium]